MEGNWNGALGQNKYQLTSMEWQDDFGLGWSHHNARFYDPAVGRWWAVDILAEKYLRHNPYNYVMNNPTGFIDPSGMNTVYDWDSHNRGQRGVYRDTQSGQEVSFEQAIASTKANTEPSTMVFIFATQSSDAKKDGNSTTRVTYLTVSTYSDGSTIGTSISAIISNKEGKITGYSKGIHTSLASTSYDAMGHPNTSFYLEDVWSNPSEAERSLISSQADDIAKKVKENANHVQDAIVSQNSEAIGKDLQTASGAFGVISSGSATIAGYGAAFPEGPVTKATAAFAGIISAGTITIAGGLTWGAGVVKDYKLGSSTGILMLNSYKK